MTATLTRPATLRRDGDPPRRWRKLLVRLGGVLAASALIGTLVWLAFFSSVLAARSVTVTGLDALDQRLVLATADVRLGRPMLRQDVDAIARRIATLRPVRSVTVSRDWPDVIRITVAERKPVLAIRQPAGYLLADAAGISFRSVSEVPRGVRIADANPDDPATLTALASVAAALPDKLGDRVATLQAGSPHSISVNLDSEITVSWGSAADSALKADITLALLKRKPTTSINVSSPHNPAFR